MNGLPIGVRVRSTVMEYRPYANVRFERAFGAWLRCLYINVANIGRRDELTTVRNS
jgi:hypothetical protein